MLCFFCSMHGNMMNVTGMVGDGDDSVRGRMGMETNIHPPAALYSRPSDWQSKKPNCCTCCVRYDLNCIR